MNFFYRALLTISLLCFLSVVILYIAGYDGQIPGPLVVGMFLTLAIAFEVGMQNEGLASRIAADMGRAATMGLAPAIFGTWMNISGSFLANIWRRRPVKGESIEESVEIPQTAA